MIITLQNILNIIFAVPSLTVALEVRFVGLHNSAPHIAGGGHGGILDGGIVARGHLKVLATG